MNIYLVNPDPENGYFSLVVIAESVEDIVQRLERSKFVGLGGETLEERRSFIRDYMTDAKIYKFPDNFKFVVVNENNAFIRRTVKEICEDKTQTPGVLLSSEIMGEDDIPTEKNVERWNRRSDLQWLMASAEVDAPREVTDDGKMIFDLSEPREVKAGGFTLGKINDLRPANGFNLVLSDGAKHVCADIEKAMEVLYDHLMVLHNKQKGG